MLAALVTASLTLGSAVMVPLASAATPTVSMTSPANGSTEEGTFTLTATASTTTSGDGVSGIRFYKNGSLINDNYYGCNGQTTCNASYSWNTTGMSGSYAITAEMTSNDGANATSSGDAVTIVSLPPVISMTGPPSGSTIKGSVTLQATASINSTQSDSISGIRFYANGALINDNYYGCNGQTTCNALYSWDTTGLSGQYSITAEMTSGNGIAETSGSISLTIVSPLPTILITHPENGSGVRGAVIIRATATIDPSQSDSVESVNFYANGSEIGSDNCGSETICDAMYKWSTRGLSGTYKLTAQVITNNGVKATSSRIQVVTFRKTKILLDPTHAVMRGNLIKIAGKVEGTTRGVAPSGLLVRVTVEPVVGRRTDLLTHVISGKFSVKFRPTQDSKYQVAVIGNSKYGSSSGSEYQVVLG